MIFMLIGIAYVLLLAAILRFFQAVHRWDEEISSMELREEIPSEHAQEPKAA